MGVKPLVRSLHASDGHRQTQREASCEIEGCDATTQGHWADGWPENEGWTVTVDDAAVYATASYHFFCPAHAPRQ
jgi:hypothetical protein